MKKIEINASEIKKVVKAKKPTFKALSSDPRFINEVNTDGNRKLVNTDKVVFVIWNIPSVITCPFRTVMCEKYCYATKAENCYPDCLPYRERSYKLSLEDDFAERMIYTLEAHLSRPKFKGKTAVVRIHESGDFYSKAYLEKWLEVARHFVGRKGIVFECYTKSLPFFVGEDIPANFKVNSSIWADTDPAMIELTHKLGFPVYTADTEEGIKARLEKGDKLHVCRCENCGGCLACLRNIDKIVKIH